MGCAREGVFIPLWSERILEEWRRAAERNGIGAEARVEIALLQADWPVASVAFSSDLEADLHLPDENDGHVLAAAIAGDATELLTANTSDFPTRILGGHGVLRRHPDEFLLEIAHADAALVRRTIDKVHDRAEAENGAPVTRRKMLQKAGMPRLAKWDAGLR